MTLTQAISQIRSAAPDGASVIITSHVRAIPAEPITVEWTIGVFKGNNTLACKPFAPTLADAAAAVLGTLANRKLEAMERDLARVGGEQAPADRAADDLAGDCYERTHREPQFEMP